MELKIDTFSPKNWNNLAVCCLKNYFKILKITVTVTFNLYFLTKYLISTGDIILKNLKLKAEALNVLKPRCCKN